jgi:hypothetical protein
VGNLGSQPPPQSPSPQRKLGYPRCRVAVASTYRNTPAFAGVTDGWTQGRRDARAGGRAGGPADGRIGAWSVSAKAVFEHTFPSRLREGSGEGATYVLASGQWGTPLPQPLPQAGGEQSAQAAECCVQPRGLGGLVGVVGLGLFHRFGLGAFDEAGVAETAGQRVALLLCRRDRLGQAGAFGV